MRKTSSGAAFSCFGGSVTHKASGGTFFPFSFFDSVSCLRFDWGGDNVDLATAVAIQDDGKIVAVGRAGAEGSSTDADMAVVRLLQDGVLFADGFETSDTEIWSGSNP